MSASPTATSKNFRQTLGKRAEEAALKYLAKQGMELRHRNWRCRAGEIDLVVRDKETLVFVEVKSRSSRSGREPYLFENITAVKIRRVRLLAEIYLSFYYHKRRHPDVRIDVVGVMLDANSGSVTQIKHIRAAF